MRSLGSSGRILKAIVRRLVCLLKGHYWVDNGTRYVKVTKYVYDDDARRVDQITKPVEVTRFTCVRCPKEQHGNPVPFKYERGY